MGEVTFTRSYASTTETLTDAWAFVMTLVDEVGPDPCIEIRPTWFYGHAEHEEGVRMFEVVVEGSEVVDTAEPREGDEG